MPTAKGFFVAYFGEGGGKATALLRSEFDE
jgi:hypothetical protein